MTMSYLPRYRCRTEWPRCSCWHARRAFRRVSSGAQSPAVVRMSSCFRHRHRGDMRESKLCSLSFSPSLDQEFKAILEISFNGPHSIRSVPSIRLPQRSTFTTLRQNPRTRSDSTYLTPGNDRASDANGKWVTGSKPIPPMLKPSKRSKRQPGGRPC